MTNFTIFDNFDNPGDMWHLRHWLQFLLKLSTPSEFWQDERRGKVYSRSWVIYAPTNPFNLNCQQGGSIKFVQVCNFLFPRLAPIYRFEPLLFLVKWSQWKRWYDLFFLQFGNFFFKTTSKFREVHEVSCSNSK